MNKMKTGRGACITHRSWAPHDFQAPHKTEGLPRRLDFPRPCFPAPDNTWADNAEHKKLTERYSATHAISLA
jgi:hypothetical protein